MEARKRALQKVTMGMMEGGGRKKKGNKTRGGKKEGDKGQGERGETKKTQRSSIRTLGEKKSSRQAKKEGWGKILFTKAQTREKTMGEKKRSGRFGEKIKKGLVGPPS